MQAKTVLYAAVGAPVVVARKVGDRVNVIRNKISDEANGYGQAASKAFEGFAAEGEKIVTRFGDGKMVDEITAKVDFDQAKEQVSKLRDQLEDMLATWRSSFRPEGAEEEKEAPAAKKPAAKATAKKPAAKSKTSAAKTSKSTAAKTSSEEPETADTAEKAS